MRNKFIYVCSPFRGTEQQLVKHIQECHGGWCGEVDESVCRQHIRERNSQRVKEICKAIISECPDIIPIAPHIYAPQFLADEIPEERAAGIEMGLALLSKCSELWLFDSDGISEGMASELKYAKEHGIEIVQKNEEFLEKWSGVL